MHSPVNIRFALVFFVVAMATASSNKAPSHDDNNKAVLHSVVGKHEYSSFSLTDTIRKSHRTTRTDRQKKTTR